MPESPPDNARPASDEARLVSDSVRLAMVREVIEEASKAREPSDIFRVFGPRMWRIRPIDAYVSVSTRNLPEGQYKVTRRYTVEEMLELERRGSDPKSVISTNNPWRDWHSIPAHTGGFLGSVIADGVPKIVNDLDLRGDVALGDSMASMRSAMVIPLLDDGKPINWAVQLRRENHAYTPKNLEDALLTGNLIGAMTRNLVAVEQVRKLNDRLRGQLEDVARLQQALLPRRLPEIPGLALATSYLTSDQAGGDYYDFFELPGGYWGIMIADASGHGAAAATVMAMLHAIVHSYHTPANGALPNPAGVIAYANERLYEAGIEGNFVTAFLVLYNPHEGKITYASSGHNPPILRASDGAVRFLDGEASLPLGILPTIEGINHTIDLNHGDTILLYTDGITEAFSPGREMYGAPRLMKALSESSGQSDDVIEAVHKSLYDMTGLRTREDDQTLVAIQYLGLARNDPLLARAGVRALAGRA